MFKLKQAQICICCFLLLFSLTHCKLVYIIAPAGLEDQKLFDLSHPIYNHDGVLEPFVKLKQAFKKLDYNLITATYKDNLNAADFIICGGVPQNSSEEEILASIPRHKLSTILWEPPVVDAKNYEKEKHKFFKTIFTWRDDFVDDIKYKKIFFPQPSLIFHGAQSTYFMRKWCTLIFSNKQSSYIGELYSQRVHAINFFSQHTDFEFFGIGWDPTKFARYRGAVLNKNELLRNYLFCICFENMSDLPGYVTEKIWDALLAGCIPIYWGASNITDYIPANCFINMKDFQNFEALHTYMRSISENEYKTYMINIQNFLNTQQANLFSVDFFIYSIINTLLPHRTQELFDQTQLGFLNSLEQHVKIIHKKYSTERKTIRYKSRIQ